MHLPFVRSFFVRLLLMTASTAFAEEASFTHLRDFIERTGVKSVEEFMEHVPEQYLRYTTLVYASRSLQHAEVDFPRIVAASTLTSGRSLSGPTVFLGIAGKDERDPSPKAGERDIEVIEFRDDRFTFFRIHFPEGSEGVVEFQKDPAACSGCHGQPKQPIWDTYGGWPGVYGSVTTNTGLPGEGWEAARSGQLAQTFPGRRRYKRVVRFFGEHINDAFGNTFNQQVAQTVARELRQHRS